MTATKKDIGSREDVVRLVDGFYDQVRRDPLLSPVFSHVDWPAHLPVMYSFWASILLGEGSYQGNPLQKHIHLAIHEGHFERWLSLFTQTVRSSFDGPKADEAVDRAQAIASLFRHRLGLSLGPSN
ncbi:MAG: group III truncated hemoglobin [Cyclobacteriaceae bacterium]|nr:group III truncated hemoglobin [Cyclobacteriaceae bacterium]